MFVLKWERLAMKLTKEAPKEDGFYWVRFNDGNKENEWSLLKYEQGVVFFVGIGIPFAWMKELWERTVEPLKEPC